MATPASSDDAPLPEEAPATAAETAEPAAPAPARPPGPTFNASTFLLTFLFVLGILMLFDTSTRNAVATELGLLLAPTIGFHGQYILLTMFLAAVIEMILTALAYNWATDWFKAAKVGQWGGAFRKVQMAALRSGKKDRIEALKPAQAQMTQLSTDVSVAQLKGMAVTWFLVIAIYTWVGLYLGGLCDWSNAANSCLNPGAVTTSLFGAAINIYKQPGWFLPPWFVLFSLYTVPMSLLFRRLLKHYTLRQHAARASAAPGSGPELAGGVS
ncbi:MAG: EMC3/TMCO1 family protein [Thermoplasmata archaeon]|nr:EMC3/TMCO1 family protein [Thermoplasmata archaeon]